MFDNQVIPVNLLHVFPQLEVGLSESTSKQTGEKANFADPTTAQRENIKLRDIIKELHEKLKENEKITTENAALKENVANLEKQIVLAALEKSKIIQNAHEKEERMKEKESQESEFRKRDWESKFQDQKHKMELLAQELQSLKSRPQPKNLLRVIDKDETAPSQLTKSPSKLVSEAIKSIENEVIPFDS